MNVVCPIVGTCKEMCPIEEMLMREREKLLHKLEMLDPTVRRNKAKADPRKVVKMYCRSAAGREMQKAESLRPAAVLLETINYLLGIVINSTDFPWNTIYDFVTDRLRSVRQDMVVQLLSRGPSISILQPIVRFYAYSAYRLCEFPISDFDPVMNGKQLQECIKRLLVLYDDSDFFQARCEKHGLSLANYEDIYLDSRPVIEAMYLLHNLGDTSAIARGLTLANKWRTPEFQISLKICINYRNGNWVRACRLIKQLPVLLAATASLHLPKIRRKAFAVMSSAYNSKQLRFSMKCLRDLLLYSNTKTLVGDLKYYNITFDNDYEYVQFTKGNMPANEKTVLPRHEDFVDTKLLGTPLTDIVLYGDM